MLTHVLRGSTGPKTQRLVTACSPPHVGAYRSFLFDEVLEGVRAAWADIRRLVSEGSRAELGGRITRLTAASAGTNPAQRTCMRNGSLADPWLISPLPSDALSTP